MQVKIYATCNGLEKIYPGQRETSFNDIRTAEKSGKLGKKCYSIALTENGVEFSKFINVDDSHSQRSGFMRILIELNYNEFNNGQNVFELLNCIHDLFKSQYIDDNNRVDLESFNNNTDVLEGMISGFSFRVSPSRFGATIIKERSNKNAYFYYKSTEELIRIFDQPKQNEFLAFDTIYFINENERSPEVNPLHQFINYNETTGTDLTNVVDLDNLEYQIIGDANLNFKIKVHTPSGISEKHLGDFIRLKDNVTIIFSKPYYNDEMYSGSLLENNFGKYLKVDHSRKIVEINEVPSFNSPMLKDIQIECLNVVTNKIIQSALELEFRSNGQTKYNKKSSTMNFSGEELNMTWNVNLLDNSKYKLHKSYISLTPINHSKLVVELFEVKSIKFQFKDEKGKKLNDEDVQIINPLNKTHIDYQRNIVTFEGTEISRKHNIEFKYKEGYRLSQSNVFLPVSCSDMVALSFEKYTKTEPPVDEKKWIKYAAISFLCLSILTSVVLYDVIPVISMGDKIIGLISDLKEIVVPVPPVVAPGADTLGADKPGSGKLDADTSDADKPGSGKPDADKPGADKPGSGKPDADKPGSGKPDADKPGSGKPGSGKPGSGKPSAAGAGKAAAEASNVNDNDKSGDNLSSADKEIKNNENGYTMNDFNNDILTFQLNDINEKIESVKYSKLQKDMKKKLKEINEINGFWDLQKKGRREKLNKPLKTK